MNLKASVEIDTPCLRSAMTHRPFTTADKSLRVCLILAKLGSDPSACDYVCSTGEVTDVIARH